MRRLGRFYDGVIITLLWFVLAGCATAPEQPLPTATATLAATMTIPPTTTPTPRPDGPPERLRPEILAVYPHDQNAFTEGLVLDGTHLYESTGEYGESTLREVDLKTGGVLRSTPLQPSYFGEGLALYGDQLIQLTWREKTALIYEKATFTPKGQMSFDGEGWGLCFDGQKMFMTDGSSTIIVRSPDTFRAESTLSVILDGQPVSMLNELECVGDSLYANVWHTNNIMRVDKSTGRVTGVIDAAKLLTPAESIAAGKEGVLNGIAYDPDRDVFLITGKRWPKLFEVWFVASNP